MGDRSIINRSLGGRQSLLDGEAILSAMGGVQSIGAGTLDKLRRNLASAGRANPETSPLAAGVTVTTSNADDATLPVQRSAKILFVQNLMAPVGGQFYYSNTSERGVITSNNLAGDTGNLGGTLPSPMPTPPAQENAFGPSYYKFGTDAPKVQVRMAAAATNSLIRVRVDGRYVNLVGHDLVTNTWLNIDFGGVRQPRLIEIETHNLNILFYIRLDEQSAIWNPTPVDALSVIRYGDSHTEGAGNGSNPPIQRWLTNSRIYADLIGAWDFRIASVRSSGYVHTGSSGVLATIGQTMDLSISAKAYDIVEFAGGFNDTGKVYSQVYAAALAAWKKARAAQPNALIVVWGIWGAATGPSAGVIGLETGLKAQFAAWADPFSIFVPVSSVPEPWETGTGNVNAPNGTGNADTNVGPDALHATVAGHAYRGGRQNGGLRDGITAML